MSDIRSALLAIAGSAKRRVLHVNSIPGYTGRPVFVREMTAGERDEWETKATKLESEGKVHLGRASLVVACVCDRDGNIELVDGDLEAIAATPSTVIDPIVIAARRINGMLTAAQEAAVVENFPEAPEPGAAVPAGGNAAQDGG